MPRQVHRSCRSLAWLTLLLLVAFTLFLHCQHSSNNNTEYLQRQSCCDPEQSKKLPEDALAVNDRSPSPTLTGGSETESDKVGRVDLAAMFSDDGTVRNCITGAVIGRRRPLRQDGSVEPVNRGKLMTDVAVHSAENETAREISRKAFFKWVFETRAWGSQHDKNYAGLSASGDGSTLRYAQETIAALHALIAAFKQFTGADKVRLVDLSCGDLQWMSRFLETRDDVDYTGFDVVPALIEQHRTTYAQKPWHFEQRDMVLDNSSLTEYDIILARHTFMHLTSPDVIRVLKRLSKPDEKKQDDKTTTNGQPRPRLLLATTFSDTGSLTDKTEMDTSIGGGYRQLNLELPPVALTPPQCLTRDGGSDSIQFLGMWTLPLWTLIDTCTPANIMTVSSTIGKTFACVDWTLPGK